MDLRRELSTRVVIDRVKCQGTGYCEHLAPAVFRVDAGGQATLVGPIVSDEALELVVTNGYSMAFGARFLKRYIDEQIKLPISARWKDGTHFDVKAADGQLVVEASIAKTMSAAEAIAYGDVA